MTQYVHDYETCDRCLCTLPRRTLRDLTEVIDRGNGRTITLAGLRVCVDEEACARMREQRAESLRAYMRRPVPGAAEALREQERIDKQNRRAEIERVRRRVLAAQAADAERPEYTVADAARDLGINQRTLNRRLAEYRKKKGTS